MSGVQEILESTAISTSKLCDMENIKLFKYLIA